MTHNSMKLPDGWVIAPLAELTTHKSGNSKLIKGKLSNVPDQGLYPGFSASGQDVWLDTWDHEGKAIVVSAVGARCGKAFLSSGRWSAIANTHVVKPLTEAINAKFLWYRLNDERFWIRSGTAQPFVKVGKTLEREFALPPISEQHRIVKAIESYLTRLDAAVALLERVQRNLKRYRASVLKAAVEGRLVPTEAHLAKKEDRSYEPASELLKHILVERRKKWIENAAEKARAKAEKKACEAGKLWTHADDIKTLEKERAKAAKKYKEPAAPDLSTLRAQAGTSTLPTLPEGWCWATLESLAVLVTDGDHNPPKRVAEGVPHLTAKHVKSWRITTNGCSFVSEEGFRRTCARYEPFPGDLIVTCVGTVGEAAIVPNGFVFSADRNLAGIRLVREGVVPEYLLLVLSSPTLQNLLHNLSGSTAQPHLYLGDLRKLLIPISPKVEQERIVARVAEQVSYTERLVHDLDQARIRAVTLRQSILKWAFEGKLVEQDPNDLPASVLLERIKAERESMQPRKRRRTIRKKKDEQSKHDEQLDLLGGKDT